jgi:hypothetical protein
MSIDQVLVLIKNELAEIRQQLSKNDLKNNGIPRMD